jgi:type II secretory pathway pseudopilin PulG
MIVNTRRFHRCAFSLVEVCVAIVVCVVFGAGAFVTNQRLLIALKAQKETTAATMVMQQRMETLRASGFSNIASASYLKDSIIASPAGSEAPLGNLTETITVSAFDRATGGTLADFTSAVVRRSSAAPNGTIISAGNLPNGRAGAEAATLLRVDVLLNWKSADSRPRTRELSSIFTIGNIAP